MYGLCDSPQVGSGYGGCERESARRNLQVVGAVCARVPSFPIMVEIRNGGPLWQMCTREEGGSALSAITVARTGRAGSAAAAMPVTVMVRADPVVVDPIGAKAVVETVIVAETEDAAAERAGTAAETTAVAATAAGAMGIVAGAVAACATTDPIRAVRASARTAWRRRSRSPICRRAWKSPTWILLSCRI